jgi:hypothetical protein
MRTRSLRWEANLRNGICSVEFDRKDIEMNKLVSSSHSGFTRMSFFVHPFPLCASHVVVRLPQLWRVNSICLICRHITHRRDTPTLFKRLLPRHLFSLLLTCFSSSYVVVLGMEPSGKSLISRKTEICLLPLVGKAPSRFSSLPPPLLSPPHRPFPAAPCVAFSVIYQIQIPCRPLAR